MRFLFDLLYLLLGVLLLPWLVWRSFRTGRYRRHPAAKLFGTVPRSPADAKTVWFHGVSVGEVHLLVTLVNAFRTRHPDWRVVVSSTTDTGLAEAVAKFPDLAVIAYPFDFSWACGAALDRVRPAVVVLAESELWPNFLAAASRRGVPVVVANGRISPRTFARQRRVKGLVRWLLLRHVRRFAVQTEEYAERLRHLGVSGEKIAVTGSVKYDGATGERDTAKGRELARLLGLVPLTFGGEGFGVRGTILVAGSTHAPEEAILLAAFASLRGRFPHLRLVLVPRHPDRFHEVAELVKQSGLPFARRSELTAPTDAPVVLLDTVGELAAAWGLADVGYTGGSLDGKRGGQSMIEPAGYGVPVVFGPHVWNFRDAARMLVEARGAVMVKSAEELGPALAGLIADAETRARMGGIARDLVRRQQGATARTLDVIDSVLGGPGG